jgi:YHS domain-containing protein
MKKILFTLFIGSGILAACNNNQEAMATKEVALKVDSTDMEPDYSMVKFDNTKDPVCGMPVSGGVSDTAHYQGKVLGFCAKECKEEFLAKTADFTIE